MSAPNTRVQRTRSRSPLTRKPLGHRKQQLTASFGHVLAIATVFVALGCGFVIPWKSLYRGPGEFERAPGAYRVSLGTVQLSVPNRAAWTFSRLGPRREWLVGLRIRPEPSNRPGTRLHLRLENERGQVIFDRTERLHDWNWWGQSFLSLNGQNREAPLAAGGVQIERLGVGIERGWGSHFTPRYSGTYIVTAEVLEGDTRFVSSEGEVVLETYFGSL